MLSREHMSRGLALGSAFGTCASGIQSSRVGENRLPAMFGSCWFHSRAPGSVSVESLSRAHSECGLGADVRPSVLSKSDAWEKFPACPVHVLVLYLESFLIRASSGRSK